MVVVNHKRKFVFVHIPKTAGSSIEKELAKLYPSYIWRPSKISFALRIILNLYPNPIRAKKHDNAIKIRQNIGDKKWEEYFTFAFVRNPWDLMVSSYEWWVQKAHECKVFEEHVQKIKKMSFSEFIHSKYGREMINEVEGNIFDWISDEKGKIIVNFVGKFENIDEDYKKICERIGLPYKRLPHINKTKRKDYKKYYNKETKDIIAKRFKKTIDKFGYKF